MRPLPSPSTRVCPINTPSLREHAAQTSCHERPEDTKQTHHLKPLRSGLTCYVGSEKEVPTQAKQVRTEMRSKMKLVRNANQARKYRPVMLIAGFLAITVTFLVVSKPQSLVLSNFGFKTSLPTNTHLGVDIVNGDDFGTQGSHLASFGRGDHALNSQTSDSNDEKAEKFLEENNDIADLIRKEKQSIHELTEESSSRSNHLTSNHAELRIALPRVPNDTVLDHTQPASSIVSGQLDSAGQIKTEEKIPLCDVTDPRFDICEMHGDIRIVGNSTIILTESSQETVQRRRQQQQRQWHIRPYPRKGDPTCLSRVRQLTVKSTTAAPPCSANHHVSALVFSVGGYTGNLFHDFTDLIVPLFVTSHQFRGEVQFLAADWKAWWIAKYLPLLRRLSNYTVTNLDEVGPVAHCFKKVVVGLRAHKEFRIDPRRAPGGCTMADFTRFVREAFSLEREVLGSIEDFRARKPRLLLIARKGSRAFTNVGEIVAMASDIGYEVVVEEADAGSDMARFARVVSSCDVMVGVHGAGLTNMVFLPRNATVVQIVPWGGLEWIAMIDFGEPAAEMGLNYMQYSIGVEESTLLDKYPREHAVIKDPLSFQGRGFHVLRTTFMEQQNVKLDVKRFRPVLWKALQRTIQ